MRKNKLTLAVLAILTVVLVTMLSCKKEEIELTNDKEKNYANKKVGVQNNLKTLMASVSN